MLGPAELLLILLVVPLFAAFLYATARLARKKGRNAWAWTVLTAAFPALFLLLLMMRPLRHDAHATA